jgi:hypothetical protein
MSMARGRSRKSLVLGSSDLAGTCGENGDSGQASNFELNGPTDARPLPNGGFLIADSLNCRVLEVSAIVGGTVRTVVPGTPGGCASLLGFVGTTTAAIPALGGSFLVADNGNQIQSVSSSGVITTVAGVGAGGPHASAPVCTVTRHALTTVGPKRRGGHPLPKNALVIGVRCTEAAQLSAGGAILEIVKHKRAPRRFGLSTVSVPLRAGVVVSVTLKLPGGAITGLEHHAKESAALSLSAHNVNGTHRGSVTIKL